MASTKTAKLSPAMEAAMWDIKRGWWYLVPARTLKALMNRELVQVERRQVTPDRIYTNGVEFTRSFTPEGDTWIWNARGAAQAEATRIAGLAQTPAEREAVFCESHDGAHFTSDRCVHAHLVDPALRAHLNREALIRNLNDPELTNVRMGA